MPVIDARAQLREHGLFAKKSFGQNFLVAERVIRTIAEACVPPEQAGRAQVVEFGAGLGALTAALVVRARTVTAIERDRDLVPILMRTFGGEIAAGRCRIVEADAQAVQLEQWFGAGDSGPKVLCGNLPYQITGRLLQRAIHQASTIDRAVFMVQAEVADRLLAVQGTKAYGALTVFVRAAFDVSRVMAVAPGCFHPSPGVTSAVVRLVPVRPPRARETDVFRALVRHAFSSRRKTLRNAWSSLGIEPARVAWAANTAGISLDARGETLDAIAFGRMATALEAP